MDTTTELTKAEETKRNAQLLKEIVEVVRAGQRTARKSTYSPDEAKASAFDDIADLLADY